MAEGSIFYLGDKLPTVYDAAITINSVCRKPNSDKMRDIISVYGKNLILLWTRSFGEKHVISRSSVIKKIETLVKSYYNLVYNKAARFKAKHGSGTEGAQKQTMRALNRAWRQSNICIQGEGKRGRPGKDVKKALTNDYLLDIGKDMHDVTGREKTFYEDQKSARECRLSEKIDEEFEIEQAEERSASKEEEAREEMERSHADAPEFEECYTPVSRLRFEESYPKSFLSSAPILSSPPEQTNASPTPERINAFSTPKRTNATENNSRKPLRGVRNFFPYVKDAIVTASYESRISLDKARVAYKVFALKVNGDKYYLSREEQLKYEPKLDPIIEGDEPESKKPRTSEDYKAYEFVLPDRRVLGDFKHNKAMQKEIIAAKALAEKASSLALLYITTQHRVAELTENGHQLSLTFLMMTKISVVCIICEHCFLHMRIASK